VTPHTLYIEDDEEEDDEEWNERVRVLQDARHLKQVAGWFRHPEAPVAASTAMQARCYFDRASAPERQSLQEMLEHEAILADVQALKSQAQQWMHPERPVAVEDATATARCYFDRPSAPEQVDEEEDAQERELILQDLRRLKSQAQDYMHPERPVTVDATATARCYFDRPSAPERETFGAAEERARILAEAKALKSQAQVWMHPEAPVKVDATTATARCYFDRPSAPERETFGAAEERARILAEAKQLKSQAELWMHPEAPLAVDAATATARCYFDRPSAPEQESFGAAEERTRVMAEAKQLKAQANLWMHPERPVETTDPTAFGRNYFDRPSATERETFGAAEERARILAEAKQLKAQAELWRHPEAPLEIDATATARCYFDRASAPERETFGAAEERARILAEAKQLQAQAKVWMHPEVPVVTSDPCATGRNFFSRPSAPEQESLEDAQERALVLAEAQALKAQCEMFRHPEVPVVTSDPCATGRNYFSRPSAPQQEAPEDAEERARCLADVAMLRQLAMDYNHPERPVNTTDPHATGRNYFDRASAYIHDQMVHTFPVHEDDLHHYHEHSDHFGMDEDMDHMFDDMRHDLDLPTASNKHNNNIIKGGDDGSDHEGGNLSRSPSSVMLFSGEPIYD
jgi:hypothetical protein